MFKVDTNFHRSPEVLAIPARWRTRAVGVWFICGTYVAEQLTDGFVPNEVIKEAGAHRNKLREWLVTVGLWVEADGGVQMLELYCWWPKAEATLASRYANRRRQAEWRQRNSATNRAQVGNKPQTNGAQVANNSVTTQHHQNGVDLGQQADVTPLRDADCGVGIGNGLGSNPPLPSKAVVPLVGYGTSDETFEMATEERGLSPRVSVGASRLVALAIPAGRVSDADRVILRIEASGLLAQGESDERVGKCLVKWLDNPALGPHALKCCMAAVYKEEHNGHQLRGADKKAAEWQALGERYR
jgi:hypothetical protein